MLQLRGITAAALVGVAAQLIFMPPAFASSFFDEWRFPDERDVTGPWKEFRREGQEYYTAADDFNGDGKPDEAWILFRKDDSAWGLFVFLGAERGDQQVIELERTDMAVDHAQGMGIDVAPPGTYVTLCAKGLIACDPGEPRAITLKNPAIDYFRFQSANSCFVWTEDRARFERIWISD